MLARYALNNLNTFGSQHQNVVDSMTECAVDVVFVVLPIPVCPTLIIIMTKAILGN